MGKKHRAKKASGRRGPVKGGGGAAPPPKKPERYLIAAHEAGHAVARMVLVGDLDFVKVYPDNSGGRTEGKGPICGPAPARAEIEAAMLFLFAGGAAECVLASERRGFGQGLGADNAQVLGLAMMGGFTEAEVESVYWAAVDFAMAHKVEIEAVAEQLKCCGLLRGRKVAEIAAAARASARAV